MKRDVLRRDEFDRRLYLLLRGDADKSESYIEGPLAALARRPESGIPFGEGYRIYPVPPIEGRETWIYYTYFETLVWVLDISTF